MTGRSVVTIERHIIEEERRFPQATGAFSDILYDIALAAKLISAQVRRAGLGDILGQTGTTNVHGEQVKKLDEFAHDVIFRAMDHGGHLCMMASEEEEEIIQIPPQFETGNYVLLYDPLDGSSNIDANIPVGTIFSIHRKISSAERGSVEDVLQPGFKQVAAAYVLYGSSTMLVYTTGRGTHGFTLDPSIGEFVLSHPQMRIPSPGKTIYSINEGNARHWSEGQRRLVEHLRGFDGELSEPYSARYVGSMVADVHRTLLYGGIFMYPADSLNPSGKLRLLYEAAPMAMLVTQAGGRATDGERDILDIEPESLHQRVPVYLGSDASIETVRRFVSEGARSPVTR
ncbi:MAG: class 1 fructose-bisphosphatase [Gemmatimonadetes bacterium]|nr:class 1 fructose-bisphosphatase [Gemmatimonadota bacterium]